MRAAWYAVAGIGLIAAAVVSGQLQKTAHPVSDGVTYLQSKGYSHISGVWRRA